MKNLNLFISRPIVHQHAKQKPSSQLYKENQRMEGKFDRSRKSPAKESQWNISRFPQTDPLSPLSPPDVHVWTLKPDLRPKQNSASYSCGFNQLFIFSSASSPNSWTDIIALISLLATFHFLFFFLDAKTEN